MRQQRYSRLLKIAVLSAAGLAGGALMLAGIAFARLELMLAGLAAWIALLVVLAWTIRRLGVLVLAHQGEMRGALDHGLAAIRADAARSLKRVRELERQHEDLQRLVLRTFRSLEGGFETAEARATEQRRRMERSLKAGFDALEQAGRELDARQRESLEAQQAGIAGQREAFEAQREALERQRKDLRTLLARAQSALDAVAALDAHVAEGTAGLLRRDEVDGVVAASIRSAAESSAALGVARHIFDQVKPDMVLDIAALEALRERAPAVSVSPAMTRFSMEPAGMLALVEEVRNSRPGLVLELGSGASTVWLAAAMASLGEGRLVSIEHDPAYHAATLAMLRANGLESRVDLRLAPIAPCTLEDGREWAWYDTGAFTGLADVDLLLVDGPPQSVGPMSRFPAFERLRGQLAPGARIFVDDATRDEERKMLQLWRKAEPRLSAPRKIVGRLVGLQLDATA